MNIIALLTFIIFSGIAVAQKAPVYYYNDTTIKSLFINDSAVHIIGAHPETYPEFPGGDAALIKYFRDFTYLKDSLPGELSSKIVINYTVLADGSTANHVVAKGADMVDYNKLIAVFNSLPLFKPGKYLGQPVSTAMMLPITVCFRK